LGELIKIGLIIAAIIILIRLKLPLSIQSDRQRRRPGTALPPAGRGNAGCLPAGSSEGDADREQRHEQHRRRAVPHGDAHGSIWCKKTNQNLRLFRLKFNKGGH
jgi:hypothetical protein